MIIRDFASHPSVMRKEDPTWKFALGASPITEGSILRIVDEAGHEGEVDLKIKTIEYK